MLKKLLLLFVLFCTSSISFARDASQAGIITKEERCAIAKENLRALSDLSKPIYQRDDDGKLIELTYAQILEQRRQNQQLIASLCNISKEIRIQKSFYSNAINRAKGVAQKDSIELAIERALLERNYNEIRTIMEYVLDIPIRDINNFIKIAKKNSTHEALSLFNKQYRSKARNKNPQYDPNKEYGKSNKSKTKQDNSRAGTPVPNKTKIKTKSGEELYYQSNPKHTAGQQGYSHKAGTEPRNSADIFAQSKPTSNPKERYAQDSNGNIHRFFNDSKDGTGAWHWAGSTGDKTVPLKLADDLKKELKQMGMNSKVLKK